MKLTKLYDVWDRSKRAGHKKYDMRGFASIDDAYKYLSLLEGRMIKGNFYIVSREMISRITEKICIIEEVTI